MEDRAIADFLLTYNDICGTHYYIQHRPDVANRESRDIDAVAVCEGLPALAIEHTRVRSFDGQYELSRRFGEYFGPLRELKGTMSANYQVWIPASALDIGLDWRETSRLVQEWIVGNAQSLPYGRSVIRVPGTDFDIAITKFDYEPHSVVPMLIAPEGDFQAGLVDSMQVCLDHKYQELAAYRRTGATTVLLLQSDDVFLVNEWILEEALSNALLRSPHPDIDQVWLLWVFSDNPMVYCLRGPAGMREAAMSKIAGP